MTSAAFHRPFHRSSIASIAPAIAPSIAYAIGFHRPFHRGFSIPSYSYGDGSARHGLGGLGPFNAKGSGKQVKGESTSSVPHRIDNRLPGSRPCAPVRWGMRPTSSIASPHDALKRGAIFEYASLSVAYPTLITLVPNLGKRLGLSAPLCALGPPAKRGTQRSMEEGYPLESKRRGGRGKTATLAIYRSAQSLADADLKMFGSP
jgi:hypothetical protein